MQIICKKCSKDVTMEVSFQTKSPYELVVLLLLLLVLLSLLVCVCVRVGGCCWCCGGCVCVC